LLKYSFASGPYNIIGAFIIPGIAFGALMLAPFIDRGPERRPAKRPFATGFMLLAIAAVYFLTWQSATQVDWKAREEQGKIREEVAIDKNSEGYKIMKEQTCLTCHGDNLQGGPAAPALTGIDLSPEEIAKIAKNGRGNMPKGVFKGSDKELKTLSEFVGNLGKE
jgi:menaquinol-cytochrome c reductase cytochrome b/c subunit